jgi:hypothetical protein
LTGGPGGLDLGPHGTAADEGQAIGEQRGRLACGLACCRRRGRCRAGHGRFTAACAQLVGQGLGLRSGREIELVTQRLLQAAEQGQRGGPVAECSMQAHRVAGGAFVAGGFGQRLQVQRQRRRQLAVGLQRQRVALASIGALLQQLGAPALEPAVDFGPCDAVQALEHAGAGGLQRAGVVAGGDGTAPCVHVDAQLGRERQRRIGGLGERATQLAQTKDFAPQVAPRRADVHIGPEQRCQPFTRQRAFQRQQGQQRDRLARADMQHLVAALQAGPAEQQQLGGRGPGVAHGKVSPCQGS